MPKRLPTTLEKLSTAEQRLAAQAALLKKQRDALTRQRKRMEQKAQLVRWQHAGQLVEDMGLPVDDLDALKSLLLRLESDRTSNPLSTTLFAPQTADESPR